MTRNKLVGLSLAICAALAVTTVVSSAEAMTCNVKAVRVTTRTLNYDIDPVLHTADSAAVADANQIKFYFGTATIYTKSFWLNNASVEDFREGAIDEFVQEFTGTLPVFPTHFKRFKVSNWSMTDIWGLSGLTFDIQCDGQTSWITVYTNRGLYKRLISTSPNGDGSYVTAVGSAGTDTYNGSHEVFWLTNIGDHDGDGDLDDLQNCNDLIGGTNVVECKVTAQLVGTNGTPLAAAQWPLTESWWDVGNETFINPLEAKYGEVYGDPATDTDNIWRWFWTSGDFTHNTVAGAHLKLDSCIHTITPYEGPCTMQTNYVHATVMQAWGNQGGTYAPYFWSHIYEGDKTTDPASGWLSVGTFLVPPLVDSAATNSSRFKNFSGSAIHIESFQDSEHTSQQMSTTCGYKSLDMILSTRGFPYEMIHDPTVSLFDEPAYADATDWEDALAVAHLVWGYKTMCCGSWDCCPDASNCTGIPAVTGGVCGAANISEWWTGTDVDPLHLARCQYDGVNKWCIGHSGDIDGDGLDRWGNTPPAGANPADVASDRLFWRDTRQFWVLDPTSMTMDWAMNGWVEEWERFTGLIDGDGVIHWEGYPGVDDDFDGDTDEGVLPFDPVEDPAKWEFYSVDKTTEPYFVNDGRDAAVGIRGAVSQLMQKFLRDVADELSISTSTSGYSPTDASGISTCNIDPSVDHFFGGTKSIIDSLDNGYPAYFLWNHRLDEQCGPSTHYSVLDSYERIYHPSTSTYDYLFLVDDPNQPASGAMAEYNYESMDDIGFDQDDFEASVTSITFWNYDMYK